MTAVQKKKFLVSPLEWGLGHATRLTSVIEYLLSQSHEVVIAADGLPYNFLANKFPELVIERLPIKQIRYSRKRAGFFLTLFFQLPGFFRSIKKAKPAIDKLIRKHSIDYIISDNRYGFSYKGIPSVFITHQLRPMPPKGWEWAQSIFGRLHLRLLKEFDYIWVADFPGDENVVGSLSRIPWKNDKIRYLGPLSWFDPPPIDSPMMDRQFDVLVMLSGPEPHRSALENKLISILQKSGGQKILMLQGLPQEPGLEYRERTIDNITLRNHLPGNEIASLIQSVPKIICRAGVVTVFDLVVQQKPALLIPTNGQTEQEYVAAYLDKKGYFKCIPEKEITISQIDNFNPENLLTFPAFSCELLSCALTELLQPV